MVESAAALEGLLACCHAPGWVAARPQLLLLGRLQERLASHAGAPPDRGVLLAAAPALLSASDPAVAYVGADLIERLLVLAPFDASSLRLLSTVLDLAADDHTSDAAASAGLQLTRRLLKIASRGGLAEGPKSWLAIRRLFEERAPGCLRAAGQRARCGEDAVEPRLVASARLVAALLRRGDGGDEASWADAARGVAAATTEICAGPGPSGSSSFPTEGGVLARLLAHDRPARARSAGLLLLHRLLPWDDSRLVFRSLASLASGLLSVSDSTECMVDAPGPASPFCPDAHPLQPPASLRRRAAALAAASAAAFSGIGGPDEGWLAEALGRQAGAWARVRPLGAGGERAAAARELVHLLSGEDDLLLETLCSLLQAGPLLRRLVSSPRFSAAADLGTEGGQALGRAVLAVLGGPLLLASLVVAQSPTDGRNAAGLLLDWLIDPKLGPGAARLLLVFARVAAADWPTARAAMDEGVELEGGSEGDNAAAPCSKRARGEGGVQRSPGRAVAAVPSQQVLAALNVVCGRLERLAARGLFPYNAAPLIRRLTLLSASANQSG